MDDGFTPLPHHNREHFEGRIRQLVQSLIHCQGVAHLAQLQHHIARTTEQWEMVYAQTDQLSRADLHALIELREQLLPPLVRDLQMRYDFRR